MPQANILYKNEEQQYLQILYTTFAASTIIQYDI